LSESSLRKYCRGTWLDAHGTLAQLDSDLCVALNHTERDSHAIRKGRQSLVTPLSFQRRVQAGDSQATHAREDVPCRSLIGGA